MYASLQKRSPENSANRHPAPGAAGGVLARAIGGAILGGLVGGVADPLTALVGAAMCAVVSGMGNPARDE